MQSKAQVRRTPRPHWTAALVGAAMMVLPAAASGGGVMLPAASEWRNPKNTVHIRMQPCGSDRICGTVTWASDKAKADAARGGTDRLVGANLFRDFRRTAPGEYHGRVFVPDLNRTFAGQVRLEGNAMIGKGCLIGGLFCKQQVWTRIS